MDKSNSHKLILTKLAEKFDIITPEYGAFLAQAGAICFVDQDHEIGVELKVDGTFNSIYKVYWPEVTRQMSTCWGINEDTTEYGACGVAILLIRDLTGYKIIGRSYKGSGFDYWLGKKKSKNRLPFQNKARLEVSGILKGKIKDLNARVKQKQEQIKQSDPLKLPGYVIVVEFNIPISRVIKNEPN